MRKIEPVRVLMRRDLFRFTMMVCKCLPRPDADSLGGPQIVQSEQDDDSLAMTGIMQSIHLGTASAVPSRVL